MKASQAWCNRKSEFLGIVQRMCNKRETENNMQSVEKINGRHLGTRTPYLYRVKVAL
jgi:hypothetical protein